MSVVRSAPKARPISYVKPKASSVAATAMPIDLDQLVLAIAALADRT